MKECMFGYGSLINMNENYELTNHLTKQIYPVKVKNLSREWNIHGICSESNQGNQTYFGVIDDEKSWCNGILFFVSDEEMKLLDSREKYYVKKYINKTDIEFYNPNHMETVNHFLSLEGVDNIIYYHTDPKYQGIPDALYPVSKEYIKICFDGCEKISEEFKKDFIIMTKGWDMAIKYSK